MNLIKPPTPIGEQTPVSVFLAGSIEMGKAVDWQAEVTEALSVFDDLTIYNPRRDDWDSSWVQSITNPQFKEQVEWELEGLGKASVVFIYFAPETMSPISLMELGLVCGWQNNSQEVIVCCPDGFWRKGNVEIMCDRFGIPLFDELDKAVKELTEAVAYYTEATR